MSLAPPDRERVVAELGREPTRTEAALFENLWSEHCAYRSSRPLLEAFDAEGAAVVVGPGDDAAVVALPAGGDADEADGGPGDGGGEASADRTAPDAAPDSRERAETYVTLGIESHNHPSYVDPYDGAATGVGGIVRDTMSMGAYPVALADSLYFGPFDREHSRYLFEGVVEGIADYGNAIGVPTVAGSVDFHPGYVGNPLVNVACVGVTTPERLVTAEAEAAGNRLVLFGNATGRDGLGGASFASEDLAEDAETEDRPAVQVGDPYAEKRLIEANEDLVDRGLVASARDLGAAGLGGATCEMVAKGGFGARIDLERVHQREPGMNATEILLAESQERMCYEVRPDDVAAVRAVADRYDLGCSVVGEVREGNYVCRFEGETVVDAPAEFLAEGAPTNDLDRAAPPTPERDLPSGTDLAAAFETVVGAPSAASKEWIYRQYDHEVGLRTAVGPGEDAAVLAMEAAGVGLALSAGSNPEWTSADAYDGARAVAVENATNLAAVGTTPLAAVDCLNGGNPEKPEVYGPFAAAVEGLADACRALSVPVVGGNVSLYNDSASGPVPPTPTVAMVGTGPAYDAPGIAVEGTGDLLLVGAPSGRLGGSTYLSALGGSDRFPALPEDPRAVVEAVATVARQEGTRAVHDVSRGGLAVALAEMVTGDAGVAAEVSGPTALFEETPGRAVVETAEPAAVRAAFDGVAPVADIGRATGDGRLEVRAGDRTLSYDASEVAELRDVIARELD
ncbi:MAG: phosphoribosylformylglycinamidine synthase subunit PurL [Haloferacaceae archaeon]